MRHLIAGNWKMNGLAASLDEAVAIAGGARRPAKARSTSCCARRRP